MNSEALSEKELAYQKKLREYYIKAFVSEVSKIIIFLIIFLVLDLVKEYFIALLALMLLRNHGGGLHFKHYISCLAVSFLFLFLSIQLALTCQPGHLIISFSILICAALGYVLVPVTSSNRPPATEQQKKHSKRNTLLIILTFFILICVCPLNLYVYIGFWTTVLHILQLIIAHMVQQKGGK